MTAAPDIIPRFAVPFASVMLPQPEALNAELRKLFLAREAAGAQFANPAPTMQIRPGLYESRFDLFKWADAPIRSLREFCWSNLYRVVGELNGYDRATLTRLKGFADAWFHITRHGGYFGLHNHAMASWSGVYCVDPGKPQTPESGALQFPHPNGIAAMFMDMALYKLKPPFAMSPQQYQLLPGQLVLFPSWLMHQVLPYEGPGERITVAFNAWFRWDTETEASRPR